MYAAALAALIPKSLGRFYITKSEVSFCPYEKKRKCEF